MSQPCSNGIEYLVTTSETNGKGQTKYCQGGPVTHFDLPNQSEVSLRVKPKEKVESAVFHASAGPLSKKQLINIIIWLLNKLYLHITQLK